MIRRSMLRRRLAALAVAVLTASAVVGLGPARPAAADDAPSPPPVKDSSSSVVSADALPTVQIDDGVVWSQVMIGNIVYVAGNFSNARPYGAAKGTDLTPRGNLLAYNITTGNLVSGFAPNANGQVRVITKSPDGSRLYIGGDFTEVNGVAKRHVAALNPSDGSLISTFNASIGGVFVGSIAATNSTVYLGGAFVSANGAARANLAAYSSAGALLSWTPSADKQVDAMVMTPDDSRVIVGGRFGMVNGATQRGLAALDPSTGTTISWAATKDIRNGISTGPNAGKAGIYSLTADNNAVYGTGWGFADVNTGNLEGSFSADPDTGDINWVENCHGDTYSAYSDGSTVYTLSHAHYCAPEGGFPQSDPWSINQRHALAFTADATGTLAHDEYAGGTYQDWYGTPAPSMINWFPDFYIGTFTGVNQAAWSVTGNGDYLAVGGEFPGLNNTKQQYGLVRFAKKSLTTPKQGPRLSGAKWPIAVNTSANGIARVSFPANWDRDNMNLTYKLIRDGATADPVAEKTVASTFWNTPTIGLIDSKATAGSHTYRVIVSDPDGNSVTSTAVTATVKSGTTTGYPLKVLKDDASLYWRLGDPSGSTASDLAGSNDGDINSGVTLGAAGAIADDSDTAATFNGNSSGYVAASSSSAAPNTFTATAWFKTSSNKGGKILGFGNSNSGSSSNYDRHVYMDNSGHLIFGVYPGSTQTVQSTDTYNDGKWHLVAASLGPDGMHLYVDGEQVAQRADVTTGQSYTGYWRIGGDNLGGWPSGPTSSYFSGAIDEFAVFSGVLPSSEIEDLYTLGTDGPTNQPPTAAYSSTADKLKVSVDGSDSSDTDGTIASYAWDWGDGSPDGSGETATHTYTAAGDYTIKLTVTDNGGATDVISHDVTIAENQGPTAKFASTTNGLAVSVDASESADPDGNVASYAWNWGDGSAAGSGKTTSHAYSAAGDYTVKLTVTDNDGATDSVTHTVTVTKPPTGALAFDGFGRSVTSGWGSADSGGPWVLNGAASGFSVSDGTGNIAISQTHQSNRAQLGTVTTQDVSITSQVSLNKQPDGGGVYAYLSARRTSAGEYLLKLQFAGSGSVVMSFSRLDGSAETTLSSTTISGVTTNDVLDVKFQLTGSSPTTLSGKVWKASDSEPTSWTKTVTDNGASAQGAGSVGIHTYSSGSMTDFPVTASFDNFEVKAASDGSGAPNQSPTAAFTTSNNGLVTSTDGSTSTDPDGSIVSYSWNWGDGSAKGAGATTSHTYTSAGTYTITLTVTDNSGATDSITHTVDVSSDTSALAEDTFTRTTNAGWGTADSGGSWTVNGAATQYAVADGAGTINMSQARQSNLAELSTVSARDVVLTADVSLDTVPNGNGAYVYFSTRMTPTGEEMLKLHFGSSGPVVAQLSRLENGAETIMATATVQGTTSSDQLRVRFQVIGDGTTTSLSGKVWAASSAEPTAWLLTAQDTTAARQGAGAVGLRTYMSGTATRFPVVASIDNFHVVPASTGD